MCCIRYEPADHDSIRWRMMMAMPIPKSRINDTTAVRSGCG